MENIHSFFQRKFVEHKKVHFNESIEYKLRKDFISEIEAKLKDKHGLIAINDQQGNVCFLKNGKNSRVGSW